MGKDDGRAVPALGSPSNDGAEDIGFTEPYGVSVTIEGTCPILWHRWSCDAIAEKAAAAKGSKSKKTDNVESYIYRNDGGVLGIPGEYLRMSIVHGAKYKQDPRSPRKSAMDLFKAGIVPLTECATFKGDPKTWDFIDRRRVMVQRNGITRERPAFRTGWQATFIFEVILPEYISAGLLREVIANAGRVVGLADFRPTFGRFGIVNFERLS